MARRREREQVIERGCDVAVVGAGVVGMAAVRALIASGTDVRCFERGEPGNGQSAGQTRLFRHTHESSALVSLALSARAAWHSWEEELGRRHEQVQELASILSIPNPPVNLEPGQGRSLRMQEAWDALLSVTSLDFCKLGMAGSWMRRPPPSTMAAG